MNHYAEIVNDLLINAKCFSVDDFATASGLTSPKARLELMKLEIDGLINQIGRRFYSAEKTTPPAQFIWVARALTIIHGGNFTSRQFADAIGIDMRSATTQLRRMIAAGQVECVSTAKYSYKP